jgi:hypothetical protein
LPIVRGEIFKAMCLHLAAFAAISVTAEGWSALLLGRRSSVPLRISLWSAMAIVGASI